ncbi:hypothetical protein EI427_18285 [Flammeovirga pectinis]|uniref:Uncharacterized protein n=1 Tax=Flammeovirga pectinis TaxID=2494373 RepID=A0A3S9P7C9_9BACT|nr:hypothetical protein [Flammeovirga pectinis]AZQ64106.1 hypothetical protein EI427_18285 [Flammeovirga pectinis]
MKRLSLLLVILFCSLSLLAQTEEIQKISEQEYSQDEFTALEKLGPHYLSSLEVTLHELNWGLENHENVALQEEIVKVSEVYVYSAEDFRLIHYHNGDVHDVDLDQIAQKADLLMNNEGIYYYVMRE